MRTLSTQITWCRRLQWGLSLGLAVAALLFAFAGYLPAKHRLDALQGQIQSKTRDLEANQNKARNLPLLAMEVQELESRVRDYDRQFPRQADLGDFIKEITRVSQQLTLRDWKYQPGAPRRGDAYFELPIQMNFQGEFLNVFSFLTEVEHLQRLTRIRKLAIKNKDAKTGMVEVEIGLNIYFSEG
ncbi:MAG TPA: type 4a pilus biogenesis protein PilO [Tepidisphaeraceae bacterium]|jgi:Tfp pilus assembly protein PilO|nr:type 4a pilus biogenesis protein PilO [Tepidisphaeraceae bacterium]